jgi:hypothetical protein
MGLRVHTALLATGVALALTGCGGGDEAADATSAAATDAAAVGCAEGEYEATNPRGYLHPALYFYTPDDPNLPSEGDLDHLLVNDNALVVKYRPDLPAAERQALRDWGPYQLALVIVPTDVPDAPEVEAFTRFRKLTCDGVDTDQLTAFSNTRQSSAADPHAEQSD